MPFPGFQRLSGKVVAAGEEMEKSRVESLRVAAQFARLLCVGRNYNSDIAVESARCASLCVTQRLPRGRLLPRPPPAPPPSGACACLSFAF